VVRPALKANGGNRRKSILGSWCQL
jgi:hypothetical protein